MKELFRAGQVLGRNEMKKIMAGSGGTCLYCFTPGGEECWYRSTPQGSATDTCRGIYPAYGDQVSGSWGECEEGVCNY